MNLLARLTATPARRTALALSALVALVLLPFAGNFGAWDPWETHYGEVARQMLARNDFISLWWPGSPLDHPPRGEFWSKPVLTFWLEALSLKAFGFQWGRAAADDFLSSWRVEWALRMPAMLLSTLTLFAVYGLVSTLANRRAGAIAFIALLTSPQWLLISRQAITDIPFVSMMTLALCLAGLAILAPDERPLPRRSRGKLSWPHDWSFYAFFGLLVVAAVPQLLVDSIQLRAYIPMGDSNLVVAGIVPMLPYVIGFFVLVWWTARATTRRQIFLMAAWIFTALASLAKGPAGLAMPAIILGLYLVCSGRVRDILRLEIFRGALLFVVVGVPWWHANLIRHGMPFWNEQIGDNYMNRAAGRNGDRGSFDYYWTWLGYGIFPWTGPAVLGALAGFLRPKTPRQALARFALVWLMVDVAIITAVNTKFHHYVLPALPAAIILAALFIDDVLTAPRKWHAPALALLAAPLTFAAGRDLAMFPARLQWLFDYDYVLIPNMGRSWPAGDRYQYGSSLFVLALAGAAAVLALAVRALRNRTTIDDAGDDTSIGISEGKSAGSSDRANSGTSAREYGDGSAREHGDGSAREHGDGSAREHGDGSAREGRDSRDDKGGARGAHASAAPSRNRLLAIGGGVVVALVIAIASGPPLGPHGSVGQWSPQLWMLPCALMLGALILVSRTLRGDGLWALAAVALVSGAFISDRYMPDISPHWSEKHVIASYYAQRHGKDEPLVVWNLYWRGENFYTRNEIWDQSGSEPPWAWVEPSKLNLKKWMEDHRGRRVFFLVERGKLESLRAQLPDYAKQMTTVDDSNNKLLLMSAQL